MRGLCNKNIYSVKKKKFFPHGTCLFNWITKKGNGGKDISRINKYFTNGEIMFTQLV